LDISVFFFFGSFVSLRPGTPSATPGFLYPVPPHFFWVFTSFYFFSRTFAFIFFLNQIATIYSPLHPPHFFPLTHPPLFFFDVTPRLLFPFASPLFAPTYAPVFPLLFERFSQVLLSLVPLLPPPPRFLVIKFLLNLQPSFFVDPLMDPFLLLPHPLWS